MTASESDSQKKGVRHRGCLFCLAILLVLSSLFYWQFRYCFPRPWDREIRVAGVVIDGATKEPISNARVFITIYNSYGLMGLERFFFGLETDQNGEFSLKQESEIDIDGISVEASSPLDAYGRISFSQRTTNENVVVEVGPLPENIKNQPWARYDTFSGEYCIPSGQDANIEFTTEPWELYAK